MIVLAIIAVMLGVAVPSLQPDDRIRLVSATNLIASDLEYAQSLSVATPADLAMIRYDPANAAGPTYWVSQQSAPETPIIKPYIASPYLVTLGVDAAYEMTGVTFSLIGATDRITFDAFGQLTTSVEARVRLTNASGSMDVIVSPSTGFITIQNVP